MPTDGKPRHLVIFTQVFLPDPAAVGQHIGDVAIEMARRGHRVRVYAANRGYEDPTLRYLPQENIHGVDVRRLPFSSFGKRNMLLRLLGTASVMLQCLLIGLLARDVDAILVSTSPPMIGVVAGIVGLLRGVPLAYWAMDLNPDQLIALGKLRPAGGVARSLYALNRFVLRRSSLVIALDRFMAERLRARAPIGGKMLVVSPWSQEDHIALVPRAGNPFRHEHGLDDKFVVMYSGNHSPSNPLTTLLRATLAFRDDPRVRFLFVGGGLGKREVEQFIRVQHVSHLLSLPYQPLAGLGNSLSAADVHVVSLGQEMVGIIHPCKIYGAMAVGRPVLFFGPRPSHVSDLLDAHDFGWHVAHGDVDGAVRVLRAVAATPPQRLDEMGRAAREVLTRTLSQATLCGQLCDELERRLHLPCPRLQ